MPTEEEGGRRSMGLDFDFEDEQKRTEEAALDVARYLTGYPKTTRIDLARRLRERAYMVETAFKGDRAVEKMTGS